MYLRLVPDSLTLAALNEMLVKYILFMFAGRALRSISFNILQTWSRLSPFQCILLVLFFLKNCGRLYNIARTANSPDIVLEPKNNF